MPLPSELVCGRTCEGLSFPDDALISRQHCRFQISGGEVLVKDLGSTNKTRVNNVELRPMQNRKIRINDVVELGEQRLILTNQDRFVPAYIQDTFVAPKQYRALSNGRGGYSCRPSGPKRAKDAQSTLVLLEAGHYRMLRLREVVMRPVGIMGPPLTYPLRTVLRASQSPHSKKAILGAILAMAVIACIACIWGSHTVLEYWTLFPQSNT